MARDGRTIYLIGPQRTSSGPNGPHLTSSDIGVSPQHLLWYHLIGLCATPSGCCWTVTSTTRLYQYHSACIINDDRVVLSTIDAVTADVTGAGRYMKLCC